MVSKGEIWVLTRTASRSHIVKSEQLMQIFFQLMQNLSCYISTERLTWRLEGCISGML